MTNPKELTPGQINFRRGAGILLGMEAIRIISRGNLANPYELFAAAIGFGIFAHDICTQDWLKNDIQYLVDKIIPK